MAYKVGELVSFLLQQDQDAKVALRYSNHLHVGVLDFFNPKPKSPVRQPWSSGDQTAHLQRLAHHSKYRVEEWACEYTGRIWYEIVHADTGQVASLRMG